jgi:hypothetical protein
MTAAKLLTVDFLLPAPRLRGDDDPGLRWLLA